MKALHRVLPWLVLLFALVAGCGGGGGSSSGSGTSNLNVFLTDGVDDDYSSVWVRIFEVRLKRTGGGPVTVFESATGEVVDLRLLNNGQARFSFLSAANAPAGSYTGVEIELSKTLVMVPTGTNSGEEKEFEDQPGDPQGKSKIKFDFPQPLVVGGGATNLILDFVLDRWQVVNGKIRPVVEKHGGQGFDDDTRHEFEDVSGTVADLAGGFPAQNFTLNLAGGAKVRVQTTANTVIVNEDGSPNPSLANGQRVEVTFKFRPSSGTLVATLIKIEDGVGGQEDKAWGPVTEIDAGNFKFRMSPTRARGFVPPGGPILVRTGDATVFMTDGGQVITKAAFFAALTVGSKAEAEGTYDDAGQTMEATKAKLDDDGAVDDHEARGTVSNIDAAAKAFDLMLTAWMGFSGTAGDVLRVTMQANATFRDSNGAPIDAAAFFAAIADGATVEVEGTAGASGFSAKKAKIEDGAGGGGEDPAEAKGSAGTIDATAGTLTLTLSEWFGFDGQVGGQINLVTTGSTEYRDADGQTLDKAAFFALVTDGTTVKADGTFASGTLTARRLKIDD